MQRGSKIAFDYKPGSARSRSAVHARWFASGLLIPLIGGFIVHTMIEREAVSPAPVSDMPLVSLPELPSLTPPTVEPEPIPKPLGDTVEFVVRRNDTLDRIFDPWDQLGNVDATFERLGLVPAGAPA